MAGFNAEVTGFTKRGGGCYGQMPGKTLGGIIVKPPVEAYELFKSAVLGKDGYKVVLNEVVTTHESSVFIAESSRGAEEDQKADIALIANRIGQLADAPETVMQTIDENPFPAPQQRW